MGLQTTAVAVKPRARPTSRPRLGFLGVGWIGRHRMEAIARSGAAEIVAIAEPQREMAARAKEVAPDATLISSFDELLESWIDGLVIAHTWATRAAMSGVDIVTLAAMLGHSRVQMVMRYAHPTEAHQFDAMKKMQEHRAAKAKKA